MVVMMVVVMMLVAVVVMVVVLIMIMAIVVIMVLLGIVMRSLKCSTHAKQFVFNRIHLQTNGSCIRNSFLDIFPARPPGPVSRMNRCRR